MKKTIAFALSTFIIASCSSKKEDNIQKFVGKWAMEERIQNKKYYEKYYDEIKKEGEIYVLTRDGGIGKNKLVLNYNEENENFDIQGDVVNSSIAYLPNDDKIIIYGNQYYRIK